LNQVVFEHFDASLNRNGILQAQAIGKMPQIEILGSDTI
jgi:hypothetical protein